MIGLNDLRSLVQLKRFYDAKNNCIVPHILQLLCPGVVLMKELGVAKSPGRS